MIADSISFPEPAGSAVEATASTYPGGRGRRGPRSGRLHCHLIDRLGCTEHLERRVRQRDVEATAIWSLPTLQRHEAPAGPEQRTLVDSISTGSTRGHATNALPHDPRPLRVAGAVEAQSEETAVWKRETTNAQERRPREPRVNCKVDTIGRSAGDRGMTRLHLRVESVRTAPGPRRVAKIRQENGIARDQVTRAPAEPNPPHIGVGGSPGARRLGIEQPRLRPGPGIRKENPLDFLRSTVEAGEELHARNPQVSTAAQREGQGVAAEANACEPGGQVGGLDLKLGQPSKPTAGIVEDDGKVAGRFQLNTFGHVTIANDGTEPELTELGHGPVNARELARTVPVRRQRIGVPESDVDQGLRVLGYDARKDLTVPDDDPAPRGRRVPVRRSLELDRLVDGNGLHGSDCRGHRRCTAHSSRSHYGSSRIYRKTHGDH